MNNSFRENKRHIVEKVLNNMNKKDLILFERYVKLRLDLTEEQDPRAIITQQKIQLANISNVARRNAIARDIALKRVRRSEEEKTKLKKQLQNERLKKQNNK